MRANRQHIALLCGLAGCFFVGGITGAIGFKQVGYVSTLPLAAILVVLAGVPAFDDLLAWRDRR